MAVRIIPVRCAEGRRSPVEFDLPELDKARAVAADALERHPFIVNRRGHEGGPSRPAEAHVPRLARPAVFGTASKLAVAHSGLSRDPSVASVRIEVAVEDGPRSWEYSQGRLGAEIRYDPFLENAESEVELLLHLRCYMGEPVEPKPKGELPPASEIAARAFDETGLRRTLWHEYGHLLDALIPTFRYDLLLKRALSTYARALVNELWNAHIDRRLKDDAPEADKPFIKLFGGPTEAHTRPALEMMLRGIWADGREWTYRELVRAALDLPPR